MDINDFNSSIGVAQPTNASPLQLTPEQAQAADAALKLKDTHNTFMDGVTSFNNVFNNIANATLQTGAKALGASTDALQKVQMQNQLEQKQAETASPTATKVGGALGALASAAPVVALGGGGILGAAGSGALAGGEGGLSSSGNFNPNGQVNLGQAGNNIAQGALGGAILGGGIGSIGAGLNKVVGAVKNPLGGLLAPDAQQTLNTANAAGVQGVNLGMLTDNAAVKAGLKAMTSVPLAGKPLVMDAQSFLNSLDPTKLSSLVTTNATGQIGGLTNAVKTAMQGAKDNSDMLWDNVRDLSKLSDSKIDVSSLLQPAQDLANTFAKVPDTVTNSVKNIADAIDGNGAQLTFQQARDLRTQLSQNINVAQRQGSGSDFSGLLNLKNQLDDQITNWGVSTGNDDLTQAFSKANGFYSQYKNAVENNYMPSKILNDASIEDMTKKLMGKNQNSVNFNNATDLLNQFPGDAGSPTVSDELVANKIRQAFQGSTNKYGQIDTASLAQRLNTDPVLQNSITGTPQAQFINNYASMLQKFVKPNSTSQLEAGGIGAVAVTHPLALAAAVPAYVLSKLAASGSAQNLVNKMANLPQDTSPLMVQKIGGLLGGIVNNTSSNYYGHVQGTK